MQFGSARDVRSWPSLADEPCRYPDPRPWSVRRSFAMAAEQVWELYGEVDSDQLDRWLVERSGAGLADRTALLAVGSNAYPRQLFDKFEGRPESEHGLVTLPVDVAGFGVAFCPLLSRRGYVPVTLARRGAHLERTWLQWLTAEQLQRVRETEGARYALAGGPQLAAALEPVAGLPRPPAVYAWWFDSLLADGANSAWFEATDERAEQRLLARLVGAERWDQCRVPAGLRDAISQRLSAAQMPNLAPPDWELLD